MLRTSNALRPHVPHLNFNASAFIVYPCPEPPLILFVFLRDGLIPLHYASLRGHVDVVEALVAAKSDVNAQDK